MAPYALEASESLKSRRAALLRSNQQGHDDEELAEIDAALARIEADTWGLCQACGGAIGRSRLRAVPESRTCIRCAGPRDQG